MLRSTWVIFGLGLLGSGSTVANDFLKPIEVIVEVEAPPETVWKTLTTTHGVTTFFAPDAHIELRLDGPYEVYFSATEPYGQRGSEGCRVLAFLENEMLCFTWNTPPQFGDLRMERTFVVIRLEKIGENRTRVTLVNHGYPDRDDWGKVRDYFSKAWPGVMDNLKRRFDSGPLFADEFRGKAPRPEMKWYAMFLHPARENFLDGPTDAEQEAIGRHFAYLKRLMATNRVLLAGPTTDPAMYPGAPGALPFEIPAPGVVIFQAEDDAAARRIMEGDPTVQAGIFKARANPMHLALLRR
jgi:uncharacterized protein YndB with AHSA1/START domain/uncharacterized protein YciI